MYVPATRQRMPRVSTRTTSALSMDTEEAGMRPS
jgi:hypothetical protein